MRARFTDSISSTEGWSYGGGTIVAVGSVFTESEVPESYATKWLASGLLEAVRDTNESTVAVQVKAERATHPKRR
jgi:hypothetical protein